MIFSKESCLLCGKTLTSQKVGNEDLAMWGSENTKFCPTTTKDRSKTNTHMVEVSHYTYIDFKTTMIVEMIISPYKLVFHPFMNIMDVLFVSLTNSNKYMFMLDIPEQFDPAAITKKIKLLTPFY